MPISFECDCGKQYNVAEKNAGRKIRCADCGETVKVPGRKRSGGGSRPSRQAASDGYDEYEEYDEYDEYDDGAQGGYDDYDDGGQGGYDDYDDEYPQRRSPNRKKKRPQRKTARSNGEDEKSGGAMMGTGALMVVGGAVWLVLGLQADRIFFYPIIMIVLGIGSFFKGLIKGV